MKIEGKVKALAIYVGEFDHWHGKPLYAAIVEKAQQRGLAGATAMRGIMAFGANSRIHTNAVLRLWEDLPIVIHIGSGLRKQRAHFYDLIPSWNVLSHAVPVITAFNTLLVDDLYKRFPRLRWGFLETGSTWVPFVFQQTSRRGTSGAREDRDWGSPTKIVADRNLFVACEVDEDIEYLAGWVGAERMVVGTDYGHNDMGSDLEAHRILLERPDVHSDLTERIVDANARALYGLEAPTSK